MQQTYEVSIQELRTNLHLFGPHPKDLRGAVHTISISFSQNSPKRTHPSVYTSDEFKDHSVLLSERESV
jgi:hypothetical protein